MTQPTTAIEILDALNDPTVQLDQAQISSAWKILKNRYDALQRRAVWKFSYGDRVSWDGRNGPQSGVVQKTNQKTVSVRTDAGVTWRVSGAMLRKVA